MFGHLLNNKTLLKLGLDISFYKYRKDDEIPEEIGYFRKVNFLVGFFEEYGEVENCKPLVIHPEYIDDLKDRCEEVLEDHEEAGTLLPTCPGFFFGTYEYDEWYFKSVEEVKEFCDVLLDEEFPDLQEGDYIAFEIWY